jgi:hypothetical protein
VVLPEAVREISWGCFSQCLFLNKVARAGSAPPELWYIAPGAFWGTVRLRSFDFSAVRPGGRISDSAFENGAIPSVSFAGPTPYIIGCHVFETCESLREARIKVTKIEPHLFKGCISLEVVELLGRYTRASKTCVRQQSSVVYITGANSVNAILSVCSAVIGNTHVRREKNALDFWSLGCILFERHTLKGVFSSLNINSLFQKVMSRMPTCELKIDKSINAFLSTPLIKTISQGSYRPPHLILNQVQSLPPFHSRGKGVR